MKKLLPFFSLAIVLVACNSTPKNTAALSMPAAEPQVQAVIDTAGLAQFQAWKVENELRDAQHYNTSEPVAAAKPVKQPKKIKSKQPKQAPAPQPSATLPSAPQASGTEASDSGTISHQSGNKAQVAKKEGVSKAAKGAVIGGVVGAGAGAVINKKNRVVGAVVGAVIGAGGGYVLGRKMDKKDGRY